jgi:hypothetical protein
MDPVEIVKIEVNRMPNNCWHDCPLARTDDFDGDCSVLRRVIGQYQFERHPDCPLTIQTNKGV